MHRTTQGYQPGSPAEGGSGGGEPLWLGVLLFLVVLGMAAAIFHAPCGSP